MTAKKTKRLAKKVVKAWALRWKSDFNQSLLLFKSTGEPMLWPSKAALVRDWGKPNLTKPVRRIADEEYQRQASPIHRSAQRAANAIRALPKEPTP